MTALLETYLNQFLVFVYVLTRLTGLVMTAPVFGARGAPARVRAFLAVGLALIVTPLHAATPVTAPGSLLDMAASLAKEAALGLAFGLAILILFSGVQVAGQLISQLSGLSMAEIYDPNFEGAVSVLTQMLDWLALAVFFCIGGHRHVLAALLDTFQWMPPGQVEFSSDLTGAMVEITTQSFATGIRAAAPVMAALLVSILVTGLISRTLPQLNVMAVGFNINALVMFGTFGITIGAAALLFQDQVDATLDLIQIAFGMRGSPGER